MIIILQFVQLFFGLKGIDRKCEKVVFKVREKFDSVLEVQHQNWNNENRKALILLHV